MHQRWSKSFALYYEIVNTGRKTVLYIFVKTQLTFSTHTSYITDLVAANLSVTHQSTCDMHTLKMLSNVCLCSET